VHYEIEVEGRLRRVAVHRVGDGFAIEVDGRSWHVDAARVDVHTLSLIVATPPPIGDSDEPAEPDSLSDRWQPDRARSGGRSHEVTVSSEAQGRWVVHTGATAVSVTVNGRRRAERGVQPADGPQRIVAPMPGKIVRVLAATGDAVHAGQPLIVVEAMKMENELRAVHAGTIVGIHVKEGASVEAGALLIDIQ
jgi:biotin carboxyl carrier protein